MSCRSFSFVIRWMHLVLAGGTERYRRDRFVEVLRSPRRDQSSCTQPIGIIAESRGFPPGDAEQRRPGLVALSGLHRVAHHAFPERGLTRFGVPGESVIASERWEGLQHGDQWETSRSSSSLYTIGW